MEFFDSAFFFFPKGPKQLQPFVHHLFFTEAAATRFSLSLTFVFFFFFPTFRLFSPRFALTALFSRESLFLRYRFEACGWSVPPFESQLAYPPTFSAFFVILHKPGHPLPLVPLFFGSIWFAGPKTTLKVFSFEVCSFPSFLIFPPNLSPFHEARTILSVVLCASTILPTRP